MTARRPAPALRRRRQLPVPARARRRMQRVPEVIDVWFDSGAMPFAQCHAPFENQEALRGAASRPTSSARRSTRRAAGSTRCSPISRCCSTSAPYAQRRLPRPDPRRRGPEDVEVQGQHRRALGRHRPLRRRRACAGTSSPPSSRGTATASRWRRSARASACSCASCGTSTRSYAPTRPRGAVRRRGQTDLDRWIRSRLGATVEEVTDAPGGLRRDDRRPRDRRVRRRPLQLVRAPLAAALLGRRRARPSPRCASAW